MYLLLIHDEKHKRIIQLFITIYQEKKNLKQKLQIKDL